MERKVYYHKETKNISFLKVARDLKTLGVKNNMFFLALYDKDLIHVDPHSKDLSETMVMKIVTECVRNPWYFLREVVRIPDQGSGGMPYLLNRANLALTFCFLNGIDCYLTIPRQTGKTQSTIAMLLWAFILGTSNSEMFFVNIDEEQAKNNLRRLKAQRDLLPSYLQFKMTITEDGKISKNVDNATRLESSTGNSIVTAPSARSKDKADSIGRGRTQPIHYYDEVEFVDWIGVILAAAGPAYKKAAENAKRNGVPHCRIFTTTPGDLDSRACQQAMETVRETAKMTEQIYDWDRERIDEYMRHSNGIMYIEYTYKQLGLSEQWFRETARVVNNDPLKIKREILLQRMRGSSETPFDPVDIEALNSLRGTVKEELFINQYFRVDLYDELRRDKIYLIGLDPSSGTGSDFVAMTIIDPYTLKVVGSFKSKYIGPHALQQFLITLVSKYIPSAILCIERNYGATLIDNLRHSKIAHNLYFDKTKDLSNSGLDDKLDAKGYIQQDASNRRYYGVWIGTKSRDIMMSILYTQVKEYKENIISKDIIDEIMTLVKTRTGKIEAGPGQHDDSVFSYLIALYVYHHGNNLARYGFVKGMVIDEEERNKGLTFEEHLEEFDEVTRSYFQGVSYADASDYDRKMQMEIERVRSEMNATKQSTYGLISDYEDLNLDDYGGQLFEDDFFL